MNIKYISLLSLLCAARANAVTVTQKLDEAKKELLECKKSISGKMLSCDQEKDRFKQSKEAFVAPHREKMEEGINKNRQIRKITGTWRQFVPFLAKKETEKILQEYYENYYQTWGHGWIVEAFVGRSDYDFLSSDQSTTEFAKYVINDRYHAGQSSYVEDMLGNRAIGKANNPENKPLVKAAQKSVLDLVKKQSEEPIQK